MDGKHYYTFKAPKQDVRFFALEIDLSRPARSCSGSRTELTELGRGLEDPLLPSPALLVGRAARLGSADCAKVLEPLFVKYGVSVVFAGHDHFYERVKPQKGIVYFVVGSGGQLRKGNIDKRHRLDGRRHRHRPGVPGRRDRRRRAVLQRRSRARARSSTPGSSRAAASSVAAQTLLVGLRLSPSRFSVLGCRPSLRLAGVFAQSASNTACIFFAIARVADDDADLAAAVELQLAQALAADERGRAVADDRPHVQAQAGSLRASTPATPLLDLADDPDLDAGLARAPASSLQHQPVADLGVVDQQLLLRAA